MLESCELDVADQHLLRELSGPREERPVAVEYEGVAVEDEFVLSADERAERIRNSCLGNARANHVYLPLEPLPGVVGRG